MMKILHVIESLSLGGAARSLIAISKYSRLLNSEMEHSVISLMNADAEAITLAQEAGVSVIDQPSDEILLREFEQSDIVQIHYWNNPKTVQLLHKKFPPCRLVLYYHIAGDRLPQVIVPEVARLADWNLPCSPYTEQSIFKLEKHNVGLLSERTTMVYDSADLSRVGDLKPRKHAGFNVGYIGTVDYVKMHPGFLSMSAAANIPDIKFTVCGGGGQDMIRAEAQRMGVDSLFDFRGYVTDIRPVLKTMDVYGYPLREDTYAAAELNLQEVMYAGIPPVVFPHGGVRYLVENEKTGIVVHSEKEYGEALEYLYHNPDVRKELAARAKEYAKKEFGAQNAAPKINDVYEKVMKLPKRDHIWGVDTNSSLYYDVINPADLIRFDSDKPASQLFLESVGKYGGFFTQSVAPYQSLKQYLDVDQEISGISLLVYQTGLLWYLNSDTTDPRLNFWTGLYFMGNGDSKSAIAHFSNAWNNGFGHWRVLWYMLKLLIDAGNSKGSAHIKQILDQAHTTWKREVMSCGVTVTDLNSDRAASSSTDEIVLTPGNGTTAGIILNERRSALRALVRSEVRLAETLDTDDGYSEMFKHLLALAENYPGDPLLENEIAEYYYKMANFKASALWYQKALKNAHHDDYTFLFTIIKRLAEMGKIAEAVGYVSRNEAQLSQKPGFPQLLESLTRYASKG